MVCYQLTQEIIEKYMHNLMKIVETNSTIFPTFNDDDLITVCQNSVIQLKATIFLMKVQKAWNETLIN